MTFSLVARLKYRVLHWIAVNLEEYHQVEIHATMADTATLAPEGRIENHMRESNCITLGKNTFIRGRLLTFAQGGRISLGDWCYVGPRSEIWSMASVSIGNRVLIAHDVNITDSTAHSLDAQERHEHYKHIISKGHPSNWEQLPGISSAPIIIEDDVWISFGVTIFRGVRIGAGSIIAANSTVTKDVPPGMLYRCEIKPLIRSLDTGTNIS